MVPDGSGRDQLMTRNMGTLDRSVRTLLAVLVGLLIATGTLTGVAAIVLGVFAAVFLLTSFVGFCPLYAPFGWSTRPRP